MIIEKTRMSEQSFHILKTRMFWSFCWHFATSTLLNVKIVGHAVFFCHFAVVIWVNEKLCYLTLFCVIRWNIIWRLLRKFFPVLYKSVLRKLLFCICFCWMGLYLFLLNEFVLPIMVLETMNKSDSFGIHLCISTIVLFFS